MHSLFDLPFATLAGVLTIASPCVLPILPIVLGTSVAQRSPTRPLFIAGGFVVAFAALGMLLSVVSSRAELAQDALRHAGIALLALAGLMRLWPAPYDWLAARLSAQLSRFDGGWLRRAGSGDGNGAGFVLGMSLGAVWTPCAGPVLAGILALVARAQDPGWSALLLTAYAVGAGVPMLLIAYGGQAATTRVRSIARHAAGLQQGFGALMMLTAAALYFHYDVLLYAWLVDALPPLKG